MSVLRGIFLEKLYVIFQCQGKGNLPLFTGIRIEQVSVGRGSTVKFIKVNEVVITFESEDDLL